MYVIRNPNRKRLCSNFITIDSFEMFKIKEGVKLYMDSGMVNMYIPQFELKTKLFSDRINVEFKQQENLVEYNIPLEKKPCTYGGFKYYFHCPNCNIRFQILYCIKGIFLCRKCANLGYFTQRLNEFDRSFEAGRKIEQKLIDRAGSLKVKPPWQKIKTFHRLRSKYYDKCFGDCPGEVDRDFFILHGVVI